MMVIKKVLVDLCLQANGKADLYFHAFFWHLYISCLFERIKSTGDAMNDADFESIITKKNKEV